MQTRLCTANPVSKMSIDGKNNLLIGDILIRKVRGFLRWTDLGDKWLSIKLNLNWPHQIKAFQFCSCGILGKIYPSRLSFRYFYKCMSLFIEANVLYATRRTEVQRWALFMKVTTSGLMQ